MDVREELLFDFAVNMPRILVTGSYPADGDTRLSPDATLS